MPAFRRVLKRSVPAWWELLRLIRKTAERHRSFLAARNGRVTTHRLVRFLRPDLRHPLFVIGAPRSGTSFLGRCVGALPGVSYHREPVATKTAACNVYNKTWGNRTSRFFYRSVYRWLMRLHGDGDLRFSEKTPRNCFLVPFLYRTFPGAQFVHIIRDGRDAALSHSRKPWLRSASAASEDDRHGPYPRFWVEPDRRREFTETTDFHRCIWTWRRHVEAAREGLGALPDGTSHTLRYERLVANPRKETQKMLDFINVSDLEARDAFQKATQRAESTSVGAWKEALSEKQRACVYSEAGSLLRALGYADSPPSA